MDKFCAPKVVLPSAGVYTHAAHNFHRCSSRSINHKNDVIQISTDVKTTMVVGLSDLTHNNLIGTVSGDCDTIRDRPKSKGLS